LIEEATDNVAVLQALIDNLIERGARLWRGCLSS
jgi:hypothetical protein